MFLAKGGTIDFNNNVLFCREIQDVGTHVALVDIGDLTYPDADSVSVNMEYSVIYIIFDLLNTDYVDTVQIGDLVEPVTSITPDNNKLYIFYDDGNGYKLEPFNSGGSGSAGGILFISDELILNIDNPATTPEDILHNMGYADFDTFYNTAIASNCVVNRTVDTTSGYSGFCALYHELICVDTGVEKSVEFWTYDHKDGYRVYSDGVTVTIEHLLFPLQSDFQKVWTPTIDQYDHLVFDWGPNNWPDYGIIWFSPQQSGNISGIVFDDSGVVFPMRQPFSVVADQLHYCYIDINLGAYIRNMM